MFDQKRRKHIHYSTIGNMHLRTFCTQYFQSTSSMHIYNLESIIQPLIKLGKSVAILTTDNGPDWSGKSPCNVYNYAQLWKKLTLDALILNSYTPGNSRYNPVERSMSPLSNWPVGLTLKREYNSNASKLHNLDDVLICLNWDKRKYAGFQLDCYPIL
ncbi:unnamed protein product [Didymodactylos carnosus]|uniref:Uncharacterized protein n=1 Tax=Didymodactylos carnosus TaxID=1234261 RepID=A0A8S2R7G4_9BILA|nr:unnamed protein product [Didymodactylos carnosus]CAF4152709.1 unnamed protein product [Didymodactylos carnosus]